MMDYDRLVEGIERCKVWRELVKGILLTMQNLLSGMIGM